MKTSRLFLSAVLTLVAADSAFANGLVISGNGNVSNFVLTASNQLRPRDK